MLTRKPLLIAPMILFTLIGFLCGLQANGQNQPLLFSNFGEPIPFGRDTFYAQRVHQIELRPDMSFEFRSMPHVSCVTWWQYQGTWEKHKDTILFSDQYEVVEEDLRATYKKNRRQSFQISFKSDKGAELTHKKIKLQYMYDYYSKLEDVEEDFTIRPDHTIEIPYATIPNRSELASIRIEYQLDGTKKRWDFLTSNKTVNIKEGEIPNTIKVEFVERPRKEIVYRSIKGVIQNDVLRIISISKTKTQLKDYVRDIEFEDHYPLYKYSSR